MEQGSKYEIFMKKVFKRHNEIEILDTNERWLADYAITYQGNVYNVEIKSTFSLVNLSKITTLIRNINGGRAYVRNKYNVKDENITKCIVVFFDRVPPKIKEKYCTKDIHVWDISNIFYIIQNDENLVKELIDLLDFSLNSIIPEENILKFKIEPKEFELKNEENLISELNQIKYAKKDAKLYEDLCEKIIKNIFRKELGNFNSQFRTKQSLNIFDLIAKIKKNSDNEFFRTIEEFYGTKYLVFEFKNYREKISQIQICSTEKYLYASALRNVAIIFSRKGANKNAEKMIRGILRETGKLIIVLDDKDIKEMIELHNSNDDPTRVLIRKLDDILMTLEK